jgi:hypothetical protein
LDHTMEEVEEEEEESLDLYKTFVGWLTNLKP